MAAFIAIDGVWTLLLYRSRRLHTWLDAGGTWRDLPGAVVTTFCSCMTQAPVATRSADEARALRWIAWAGSLRPMLLVVLGWLDWRLLVVWVLLALGGGVVAGRIGVQVSPAAVFLVRRPPPGLGNVLRDSLAETGQMLRAYGWILAICALAAALATRFPVPGWALYPLALVVPVDLVAVLPALIGMHLTGTPAPALACLAVGATVGAVRPRRLARSYLRQSTARRWDWLARGLIAIFGLVSLAA